METSRPGRAFLLISTAFLASACGGKVAKVNVYAGHATGRVNFTGSAPPTAGRSVMIQYSTDCFASVAGYSVIENAPGLLTLPFQVDFKSSDGRYAWVRAFQDSSLTYQSGDSSGRYDGTASGNASFVTIDRVVGAVCPDGYQDSGDNTATPCSPQGVHIGGTTQDHYIDGVNLAIDSGTAL